MQFFRNRAVPSGVLRNKREQFNKTERLEATRDKRKIRCIPTSKVRKINDVVVCVVVVLVGDVAVAVVVLLLLLLMLVLQLLFMLLLLLLYLLLFLKKK